MERKELLEYQYVVGYGIGHYYEKAKKKVPLYIRVDFLCDTRWKEIGEEYDGIKVISPDELLKLKNAFVIVFSGNENNWQSITGMLKSQEIPYAHVKKLVDMENIISGRELKEMGREVYTDNCGNTIEFFHDIADDIKIQFLRGGNLVRIGKRVRVGSLYICCGDNAICSIGEGTSIKGADIRVTNGSVVIGDDCLLAREVILRNHDSHHIFDKTSQKRINYAGNMKIGNHVWIEQGAILLGNAVIGDNSIVGTMAVTSSSFPEEVIIAGNPARIIREHVCWSRDYACFYNRDFMEECIDRDALKYF